MKKDKKATNTLSLLKRFVSYVKPYRWILYLDLFFTALTTLVDLVTPKLISHLTNAAVDPSITFTFNLVLQMALIYAILRIIEIISTYFQAYEGHVMGVHIETDMRNDAFSHLQSLGFTYYSNTKIGQIMSRVTSDLFDVTEFAHHCPEEIFVAIIKYLVSFIILCFVNIYLTLIVFAFVPILLFATVKLRTTLKEKQRAQRHQVGELNSMIEDSLLGQRVVKAFTAEDKEQEKFKASNKSFEIIKKSYYKVMASYVTCNRLFDGLMYIVVLIAAGYFLVNNYINAGDFVSYIMYVTTLIATIRMVVDFAQQFLQGVTAIERFYQVMDTDIDIKDKADTKELVVTNGAITFEDVSFEYPDDHNKVFKNLNLNILPGENVALVGPSGGGKTTICNLIPRFYDVTSGKILIDNQCIDQVTIKSLRSSIGIVQQDVYLFSGTIKENIAYGKKDANEQEIIDAAIMAGADEFIQQLSNGYDTYVGEKGVKLSGGQKQRIGIARVFLKNPKILLLDEATSALDNESEAIVTESLNKLAVGRTTITVAHRLSTIKNATRIIVIGDEGILEQGSHSDLLANKSTYYRLYNGIIKNYK